MTTTLLSICPALRTAFERTRYDADSLLEALGDAAHAALGRSEPVPIRLASHTKGDLGVLIRLFLLVDDIDENDAARALAPLTVDAAVEAGLLDRVVEGTVRALLDVRPLDAGDGTRWIVSDLDGSMRPAPTAPDHVLGVGQASLSLLRGTPTTHVRDVLDVGTGCGVQAVHAAGYADSVTGTDISERSMQLAAVTAALNDLSLELISGSWFEPVAGRTFDRIVANPPFVVGLGTVEHSYRDSGIDLDGASQLMIGEAPKYLKPGGTAAILASWLHVDGEDWRARVASWLPDHGVDAWILQRDVADPALYVGTWMRDGGLDPKDPANAALAQSWLDHFAAADVSGIGFGFVYLRATDLPTDVLAEDLRHAFDDPLGNEAIAYFDRLTWLRENDVAESVFELDPATALEHVSLPGDDGWRTEVIRVHRGNGPNWQHEIDDVGAMLLAGMRAGGLPLNELVTLLAAAHGLDEDALSEAALELTVALVRHGLVVPSGVVPA
ncbi:N5-glutamine methyltransferase family protein [Rhodococcoides kyotonense]|uniref:Methyltransferase small domain-containing protein n=1 Tax=Rhodococcoides kyotonense TaxID=398843 RepID=A0A239CY94_9NOCA|nr:class I SAM-dependent methyltransferase [Rhodococcus kyotonensis]SNS25216.1 Methyltransferase small domain-containing protein [Rhodococcus kyotonensis]